MRRDRRGKQSTSHASVKIDLRDGVTQHEDREEKKNSVDANPTVACWKFSVTPKTYINPTTSRLVVASGIALLCHKTIPNPNTPSATSASRESPAGVGPTIPYIRLTTAITTERYCRREVVNRSVELSVIE